MTEWAIYREAALMNFLNDTSVVMTKICDADFFEREVSDQVIATLGVTVGELAMAYVSKIYSDGTGKKATIKKTEILRNVSRF